MTSDRGSNAEVAPVDVDAALIEEFAHIDPRWMPSDGARPRIDEVFSHLHRLPPEQRPWALCLSGGGIRSATFSLGVLQSFARSGRLRRFHYLSSVSGGGYIASWLMAWRRREQGRLAGIERVLADSARKADDSAASNTAAPPRARAEANTDRDPLARLRGYSNYLSPVWGLSSDALALVAIFLRNLLLNLSVWLPLLGAVALLPRLYVSLLTGLPGHGPDAAPIAVVVASLLAAMSIAYTVADLPDDPRTGSDQPRGTARNQFVLFGLLPLVLAAIVFSLAAAWLPDPPGRDMLPSFCAGGVLVHVLGIACGVWWRHARGLRPRGAEHRVVQGLAVVVIGALGGLLLWLALRLRLRSELVDGLAPLLWATGTVPLVLASYWVALSLYAGLLRRLAGEEEREWWSRATGYCLLSSLAWAAGFGVLLHLPLLLLEKFGSSLPSQAQLGLGSTLLGVATAAFGYWSANGAKLKRRAQGLIDALGLRTLELMAAGALTLLLLLLSFGAGWAVEHCHDGPAPLPALCKDDLAAGAAQLRQQALLAGMAAPKGADAPVGEALAFAHVVERASPLPLLLAVLLLLLAAGATSFAIGANAFSLHSMYGNRLVRAYLGATRARRNPHWFTGFDPDDNLPLADAGTPREPSPEPRRLFHVVNIALNLVNPGSRRLAWQQRKAASFTATPLRCGSDGVGYLPTRVYGGERGLSLGRAMTISGAAASPNMGYHSSALVTFVMTLLNVRLGWWMPNPGPAGRRCWQDDEPRAPLLTLLAEAGGRTTDDRTSVHLSDGGHFENLGLYEMVRRRCHRVVVVDASCDPKYDYSDLHDAVRKIRIDLGISIELPAQLPGPARTTAYPRLAIGRIRYSARDGNALADDGWLYLVKPVLAGGEPPELAYYAATEGGGKSPFPHQTTADQFFDETQFECYRLLGLLSADQCFEDAHPVTGELPWPEPLAVPVPAPVPAAQATSQEGVGAATAPASGLLASLQPLGAQAALATALTVGGTVGVVGTVALSPGEVRLSADDRALLKDGLQIKLSSGELRLTEDDRKRLDTGLKIDVSGRIDTQPLRDLAEPAREGLSALQAAATRLGAAADRLGSGSGTGGGAGGGAGGDAAMRQAVSELRAAVDTLARQLRDPQRPPADPSITALSVQVQRLGDALAQRPDLGELRQEIRAVTSALGELKTAVQQSSPSRNVRGQEGSNR